MKKGFTLAEVLITLGVIGVVAAITIPTLVSSYKKVVVANKLKKASSLLTHAYNRSYSDYSTATLSAREEFTPNNADDALEIFNKYYVPYIQFLKVEKGKKGVFGYLPDMVLYFRHSGCTPQTSSWCGVGIFVCMDAKSCKNINENSNSVMLASEEDGKNVFRIQPNGIINKVKFTYEDYNTHQKLINICKNKTLPDACAMLIFEAGWKIPDDYPIRF